MLSKYEHLIHRLFAIYDKGENCFDLLQPTLFIPTLDTTTKNHYNDNLTDTKPSLKMWQLLRFYVGKMYLIIQETYDLDIC